jgi:NAD(P)-dependent dehydrogenase (short-subunit alcohol dehydrogenase family)
MDTSVKGQTVVFTIVSRGIDRFAGLELARRGAHILTVGHNAERGAAAVDAIRGIGGSAEFLCAEIGDAADVHAIAAAPAHERRGLRF